jgi:hypothetical protein
MTPARLPQGFPELDELKSVIRRAQRAILDSYALDVALGVLSFDDALAGLKSAGITDVNA